VSPTFDRADSFKRDYKGLEPEEREQVGESLQHFIEDLTGIEDGRLNDFRASLRVKPMQGNPGIWEMTWERGDGRATFKWGTPVLPEKRHVDWRRIGDHGIFTDP